MSFRPSSNSGGLDVVDGHFSATAVFRGVEGELLTFGETPHACALKRSGVNENVLAAVIRLNESKALHVVINLTVPVVICMSFADIAAREPARTNARLCSASRCLERNSEAVRAWQSAKAKRPSFRPKVDNSR